MLDVDRIIDALGANKPRRPCPSLKRLDIRRCAFNPNRLDFVMTEREEWATALEELKLTLSPELKTWTRHRTKITSAPVLESIKQSLSNYDEEDGAWSESSRDSDLDDEENEASDDEDADEEGEEEDL